MTTQEARAIGTVTAFNLGLFILVTSLPVFQSAHHHLIFPALAALLATQWALTLALGRVDRLLDAKAARASILSAMAFLLVMGIVRHATILACFDRCAFKLAGAAAIAAPVFLAQRRVSDASFWDPLRSGLAAIGALLWAVYLALRGFQFAPWAVDSGFAILALLFWLGRDRALFLIPALGICAGLAIRATANELAIIGLSVIWSVAVPLTTAHRVDSWLKRRTETALLAANRGVEEPRWKKVLQSAGRISMTVAVTTLLGIYAIGPTFLMTNPSERRARLTKLAPAFPIRDPKTLSPLASRLRRHVLVLAQQIGERDAFQRKNQERARDYIMRRFKEFGYSPKTLEYRSIGMSSIKNGTMFFNVEAVRGHAPVGESGVWIVGAHYDCAAGTPGADDNASGVAVLLETARLLKERKTFREIRFVAFGTEEPPAFGTRNMGSYHYAQGLEENGAKVYGMISLEMLGYYNPRPGSQLYPPFLHLFYPDHGDFVAVVSNGSSRRLLGSFASSWVKGSSFPLVRSVLPSVFSSLALSDQLNFWDQGYPSLMLSDTAFYRNPHYHQETDTPATLDYEKMAEVTRALASVLGPKGG